MATMQHSGGRCLELSEAEEALRVDDGLELLKVSVSHDGSSERDFQDLILRSYRVFLLG